MLLPPGGNPERAGSFVQTESTQTAVGKIEDRLIALQREIGIEACDFVSRINYQDPFNLLSDGLYGEITRKAILKSAGSADLSDILPPEYRVARAIEEDILVNQVVSVYRYDPDFRSGVSSVTDIVLKLKPFIQGHLNFASNPNYGFVADGTSYSHNTLNPYLEVNRSGASLVTYLGGRMQFYGSRFSTPSRIAGLSFGVNQFEAAGAVFTMQKMPEIEQLLHAIKFLKEIDATIQKMGFGPSPFS